jgi:hypothetical protein
MILLDEGNINIIDEGDLKKISTALIQSVLIKRAYKKGSVISYKEDMLDSLAALLTKILINDSGISREAKLNVIDLLDKINTQKEVLAMLKSKASPEDLLIASKRLSQKSQSAFGSK